MSMFSGGGAVARGIARKCPVYFRVNGTVYQFVDEENVEAIDTDDSGYPFLDSYVEEAGKVFMTTPEQSVQKSPEVINKPAIVPQISKRAEKIILLICPQKSREYILGDLAEEYSRIAAKHGIRFGKIWYWKQVATSTWPLLEWLLKLGLSASAWEWVRRLF